ncbi:MAG TPA: pyridoxamine 5'-phosphate oxidase family protein [Propioniciclava sp.]|uniref:pyridoxamine 5'-phosphate oxidase family protein n=1 Tax=Propioniciclava sp. TaxID=2038686 RepID=UPI002B991268|nr:pyridoxamine 5'-phosphate oxidase family protein [Propioniciclava sp.]HRL49646.1 pyridoxamine 5'-phosphate oxidase family protein [Propioniciclava sp.]HRL80669.1 pyridoxamine 5'-phosphate oxidase family protein [Propioniciclava sp.]
MIPGYFVTIDADECLRLLGEGSIGRVAWASSRGLQVLPVSYTLIGNAVVFTIAEGTILGELTEPVDVAFEVDDLELSTSTGWSVMAQGRTTAFAGDLEALRSLPWVAGHKDVPVAIELGFLAGRSVSADAP